MKKVLSIVLTFALLLSVFGAALADSEYDHVTAAADYADHVVNGKTVVKVGIESDPGTMDPYTTGSSNGKNATIKSCVYQYLGMIQGVGGPLAGELAKEWNQVGPATYDIELYDYIKDTAGNAITADDVVFSYRRAMETASINNAKDIVSIEKIDDLKVHLVLSADEVTIFERIMQSIPVVSQKSYEESGDNMAKNLITSGPYKVVEWVPGSTLTLEKNEDYWQTPELAANDINQTANVDRIEFYVIKEASQLSIGLETGTIDMVYNLSATEADRYLPGGSNYDKFNMFTSLNNLTQTMFLNASEKSPLGGSKELRQAILYAIDTQVLVDGASSGYGVVCKTFGSDQLGDFQEKWNDEAYYEYDPDKAAELLKASGVNVADLNLRIVTNGTSMRNRIAQIVQGYLLAVGVKSEILAYDDTLFNTYKNENDQWDLLLDNCGTSDLLMGMWRTKLSVKCCSNGTAFMLQSDELEGILQAAASVATNGPETVDALHQYVKDNAYVYGLYNNLAFTVTNQICTQVAFNSTPWMLPSASTFVWNK
mgnify:CR=1 FL=1